MVIPSKVNNAALKIIIIQCSNESLSLPLSLSPTFHPSASLSLSLSLSPSFSPFIVAITALEAVLTSTIYTKHECVRSPTWRTVALIFKNHSNTQHPDELKSAILKAVFCSLTAAVMNSLSLAYYCPNRDMPQSVDAKRISVQALLACLPVRQSWEGRDDTC